jgi:uncharacterized SAM-binding protein YcdF (DUF218 family)
MFLAAKVLSFVTQPLAWVMALMLLGLLVLGRKPVAGRRVLWAALWLFLALGWQPLPDALLRRLEAQYPEIPLSADLRGYAGMVVLGGAMEQGVVSQAHAQPQVSDGAERMLAPVSAWQRNAGLRIVFTGGEGAFLATGPTEADRARVFYDSLGMAPEAVTYEGASRTTFENAVLTAQLPNVDKSQRWLLVTSAWHMPRSMATFEKAGWNVTAYPVDFRTGAATPWSEYSLREGSSRWQLALHELVGILAYRLTDRL